MAYRTKTGRTYRKKPGPKRDSKRRRGRRKGKRKSTGKRKRRIVGYVYL